MKAFLHWVRTYWYIPAAVAGIVLTWFLFRDRRRRGTPIAQTLLEVKVAAAKGEARKLKAELGAERAATAVADRYHRELVSLNADQHKQAEELKDDPAKLAAFLVRAGAGGE